jgi:hypothetical protein
MKPLSCTRRIGSSPNSFGATIGPSFLALTRSMTIWARRGISNGGTNLPSISSTLPS